MRREAGGSLVSDERQVALALLVVGGGEDAAFLVEPMDARRAMQGLAGFRPAGRIGATEAIHDLVHDTEGQIRSPELEGEDHSVDVVEEVQVGMGDLAGHRLGAFGKHYTYGRDVGAPVDTPGGVCVA